MDESQEKRRFTGQVVEERPGLGQVEVHPCGGAIADREHPAFSALATADQQRAGGGFVVAVAEE